MEINISVKKRHVYLIGLLILAFGITALVQGQGVSNYGHTIDQIDGFSGMIAMFDSSCPTGWTRYSELDGRFPRGDSEANVGSTGGSNEYRVQVYGSGAVCCSGTIKAASIGLEWRGESESQKGAQDGRWTNGPWAVHDPLYKNMVYCKKD